MSVDVERLMSAWLREQSEVTASCAQRVYTELPHTKTFPLVRLTLIDEQDVLGNAPMWLSSSLIQIDAYGGPKVTARQIADAIRTLLATTFRGGHDLGVITGTTFGSLRYDPDETFTPAQPRYRFDVNVYAHPLPDSVPPS